MKIKVFNSKFKRIKSAAVAAVLISAQIFGSFPVLGADVGYWADKYVNNLVQKEIMRGDQLGQLHPKTYVTRAEYVSMLNRAFGYTEKESKNPFRDVKGTEWYSDDVSIAYKHGYFSGSTKSTANPNGNLTREEAVSMLCRALKIDGITGENVEFKDGRTFSNWSRDYINSSVNKGYVKGYEDNTFRPKNIITRGEVAKIISDAAGELVNKTGVTTLGLVNGNATISKSGSILKNSVITGDLYITAGLGLGYTYLDNVKVLGDIVISGAGESDYGKKQYCIYRL